MGPSHILALEVKCLFDLSVLLIYTDCSMKRLLFFWSLFSNSLFADVYFDQYQAFLKNSKETLGPMGSFQKGELEIILDPLQIETLRKSSYESLRKEGVCPDKADKWTRVGVVSQDSQWLLLRDAVKLPSSELVLRDRLLAQDNMNGNQQIAILPITKEGEVMLVLSFRHATRSWEYEIPRASFYKNFINSKQVEKKLLDTFSVQADECKILGEMNPSSDILSSTVSIIVAMVEKKDHPGICFFSHNKLQEAILDGTVKDPYLVYGLYLLSLKK